MPTHIKTRETKKVLVKAIGPAEWIDGEPKKLEGTKILKPAKWKRCTLEIWETVSTLEIPLECGHFIRVDCQGHRKDMLQRCWQCEQALESIDSQSPIDEVYG